MTAALEVSEIFGPTIQGEGHGAGRHCLFVRLANCNLECQWCDTPYTWAFSMQKAAKTIDKVEYSRSTQVTTMTILAVVEELKRLWPIREKPTLVVISGGEPLMQQGSLAFLLQELDTFECPVHIETAGTIAPQWEIINGTHQFNVSPKLANSGNRITKRFKPVVLNQFSTLNSWFKFVVQNVSDLEEVDRIVEECDLRTERVMIMPEGTYVENLIQLGKEIVDEVAARGYGLTFRNHVFLWGSERGH